MRFLRFSLIGLLLYFLSWVGAFAVVNGIGQGFWSQCVRYFQLAWTFDGLERVIFTWLVSLGFFGIGLVGLVVLRRSGRKTKSSTL